MLAQCHARNNRCLFKGLEHLNRNTDSKGWEPYVIGDVKAIPRNKTKGHIRKCARTESQLARFPLKLCKFI